MRLEEALNYYRRGSSVRRRSWEEGKKAFELYGVPYLTRIDVEAQDWEVVRKKVSWPEAWEALQQGKKVVLSDLNIHPTRNSCSIKVFDTSRRTEKVEVTIPISWLSRTDFEIIEEAE